MAVRVEPRIPLPLPKSMRGFGRAPVNLVPRETLYVSLEGTEETLLSSMHLKGRYNIRLSDRHGVTVRHETSIDALKSFYPVLMQASNRDDFPIEPLPFFSALTENLCTAGLAQYLIAEQDGDLLGALLLITYGRRATYLYGGIGNHKRNLMAGYALQWEAMKTARALGCCTYDLYGFDKFRSPDNNYARFSRFKRLFGGTVMRFIGGHDYFFMDSLADAVVKAVNEVSGSADLAPTLPSVSGNHSQVLSA